MPIFAALNPPRVENTEARPPLKRRAYSFKRASDMEKQKVIVYVDGQLLLRVEEEPLEEVLLA